MAMTVIDLLWDHAAQAKQIKAGFTPKFTRESYLEFWKQFSEGNVDRTGF
jgi:hypothetical protein